MLLFGLAEFVCLVIIAGSVIGIILKSIKKKSGRRKFAAAALIALVGLIILVANTPESVKESSREKKELQQAQMQNDSIKEDKHEEVTSSSETIEPTAIDPTIVEKNETEKFAEKYDVSIGLAESIDEVLSGMKLTDKSRVGVFHYTISDVKSWKKLDDWAEGERYSGYMAEEHIWYFYIKDDLLVGVRDGNGNIYYTQE